MPRAIGIARSKDGECTRDSRIMWSISCIGGLGIRGSWPRRSVSRDSRQQARRGFRLFGRRERGSWQVQVGTAFPWVFGVPRSGRRRVWVLSQDSPRLGISWSLDELRVGLTVIHNEVEAGSGTSSVPIWA